MTDLNRNVHEELGADPGAPTEIAVIRSEERLTISTPWVPYRRIRISKRIVEETRTVTVDVRKEILVIEDLAPPDQRTSIQPVPPRPPIQLILHEEQLTITRVTVPVEQIRIHVERVDHDVEVTAQRAHEEVVAQQQARP
jgi:uncharacterized protein (TIGR02271 family)